MPVFAGLGKNYPVFGIVLPHHSGIIGNKELWGSGMPVRKTTQHRTHLVRTVFVTFLLCLLGGWLFSLPIFTSQIQPQALAVSTEEARKIAMKIRITIKGKKNTVLDAFLYQNETAQAFVEILPLTLKMSDLFDREKYATLPRSLPTHEKRQFTYTVGQIAYWSPSHDVAIFYRQDGPKIPSPGLIVIGEIKGSVEPLNLPGTIEVFIDQPE